jgi:hypothetical protein
VTTPITRQSAIPLCTHASTRAVRYVQRIGRPPSDYQQATPPRVCSVCTEAHQRDKDVNDRLDAGRENTMRKTPYLLAVGILCAACAPPTQNAPRDPVAVSTVTPRCSAPRDCEAMWLRAQEALQQVTGMRLRIVTDGRIETFAPTSVGRMHGSVMRYPIDAGAYEVRLQLECYRNVECSDMRNAATNLFNKTVAAK